MSDGSKRACADARALRDRLKEEGRYRDAEIIQAVVRSSEVSTALNSSLSRELRALRAELHK
jgi:hypothetical protein